MGEPEDLIIDGAYLASRLARDVWRRYAPPVADHVLQLSDVRVRIELFLNALFEMPMAVTCAEPAPPVSWLAAVAGSARTLLRALSRETTARAFSCRPH